MSFNVAMLEAMRAEGLDLDACIRVLKAGEKKADPTGAERQARFRANKRKPRNAVTVTTVTPNDNNTLTPGSEANASSPNSVFVLPGDIPAEPWAAFERMRDKIKKPMTDDARWLAVGKLRKLRDEDGWPPGEVLNHSTMNSYQGIFPPPKGKRDGTSKSAAAFAALDLSSEDTF